MDRETSVPAAEHGVVRRLPRERFGYFGWPTVARLDDGTLLVAASGCRTEHVDPYGKTVLLTSDDDGRTWSEPMIVNDTPLDDRDAGLTALGGRRVLLTWFTRDTRESLPGVRGQYGEAAEREWQAVLACHDDELVSRWIGSWIRLSEDGGRTWGEMIRVPVNTPHGPARLGNGDLLYMGNRRNLTPDWRCLPLEVIRSRDGGRTWTTLGTVPPGEGTENANLVEPHLVECPSGRLVGLIRYIHHGDSRNHLHFSLLQTESDDGGATWTPARPLDIYGSPPHLLVHSSGALVCVYGYRQAPFGQRAMLSRDDGRTWDADYVVRDDGPGYDLGYPSSVELADGGILTVYYQPRTAGEKCALLWTRWRLPP